MAVAMTVTIDTIVTAIPVATVSIAVAVATTIAIYTKMFILVVYVVVN